MTPEQIIGAAFPGHVSRETVERLRAIVDLVVAENQSQNLIGAGSIDSIWSRHIADSLQLLRYANAGPWLDLGTGAGFPGLVIGAATGFELHLCEERRLRADFLARACQQLNLSEVMVHGTRLEQLDLPPMAVISARAFAPLPKLLTLAHRFSTEKTIWVLPKGRNAAAELESIRGTWHGDFRLEPSVTDPDSLIIVATGVQPKGRR